MSAIDAIRKRPGMYVGAVANGPDLHRLALECIGNALNEAIDGRATRIDVHLRGDGSCRVVDNGRGLPIFHLRNRNMPAAELLLTELHPAGLQIDPPARRREAHIDGVGLCVVNALSLRLNLTIWQDGQKYTLRFRQGVVQNPLASVPCESALTGTEITFHPDPAIFGEATFNSDLLKRQIAPLIWFGPKAVVTLTDEREAPPRRARISLQGIQE